MALGILSDDDFINEIENSVRNETRGEIKDSSRGRNVGESVRKIISETAILEGNETAAEKFGVSKQSAAAYKNGATSLTTYNQPNEKLIPFVASVKERIVKKASKRLNLALDGITPDKLANASLRESSSVARDMAAIIREMSPMDDGNKGNNLNVQFVLHAPAIRAESDYEVIDLNEK